RRTGLRISRRHHPRPAPLATHREGKERPDPRRGRVVYAAIVTCRGARVKATHQPLGLVNAPICSGSCDAVRSLGVSRYHQCWPVPSSRWPRSAPAVGLGLGLTTPTGTSSRACAIGNARSLSLLITTAAVIRWCSRSSNRWEATLTSVPFSSRCATETMNFAAGTGRSFMSWTITGHAAVVIIGLPDGPLTASGRLITLLI